MRKIILYIFVFVLLMTNIVHGNNLKSTEDYLKKQDPDHWGLLALYAVDNPISGNLEKVESELTTDFEGYLLGALASGKNVLDVGEKLTECQLESGKISDFIDGTGEELINSHIWGIISLYAADYEKYDKASALKWLKENQNRDGGFPIYSGMDTSDLDISSMALIAYDILGLDRDADEVKRVVSYIENNLNRKESCEAYAWYILARIKLGLDVDEGLYDDLMKFRLQDGSFMHLESIKKSNYMATWHGLLALADYRKGTSVFDRLHNEMNFVDLGNDHEAYEAIMALAKKNIISGYPDNTFRPGDSVKRGEFCKFVVYGMNLQDQAVLENNKFKDLKDHWSNKIVNVAVKKEWIQGVSGDYFAPEGKIKGSEIAAILVRVKGLEDEASVIRGDNWYDGYVQIAEEKDLLYTKFRPEAYATRVQCSEAVYKLINN